MGQLNAANYGGEKLPALRPDALDGATAVVVTIVEASEGRIPDRNAPSGSRPVVRVETREFPGTVYYMNAAGVTACIEEFGSYTEDWAGHKIPLIVRDVENPATHRKAPALHVAPRNEWAGIFDGTGVVEGQDRPAPAAPRGARKSATKKGR